MSTPKTICIKIVDENNCSLGSFRFEYKTERDLIDSLKSVVPMLALSGMFIPEHLEFPFSLAGIPIQQNATEERNKHFFKTGN